jgi:putative protease
LGKLRHELIEQLDAATSQPPAKQMAADPVLPSLRAETQQAFQTGKTAASDSQPQLHVLCRSLEQISIALDCGAASVIIDLRGAAACTEALRIARRRFARIWLATPRIHRPGESSVFQRLADLGPDGMLVRNLAGLAFCRERHLPAIADFSLNAANELATRWLCDLGVERVTASFDLNAKQWTELASIVPPERLELVVFRHTPMFHSSYCVYCSLLSPGRNRTDCGQPCRQHDVRLRDRLGVAHPLQADSQCRNTLFHAEPTNLTAHVPDWLRRGVRHFRIELLGDESPDEVHRLASFVMPQNRR